MSTTITRSVDENAEKEFREFVARKYGAGKGTLSRATMDAYKKLIEEDEQERLRRSALEILNKGFKLGKLNYKTRAELYERDLRAFLFGYQHFGLCP